MPPVAIRAQRATMAWACLGLAGSIAVALTGPRLAGGPVLWWYHPALAGGVAIFYAGIAARSLAWLALGRGAPAGRRPGARELVGDQPARAAPVGRGGAQRPLDDRSAGCWRLARRRAARPPGHCAVRTCGDDQAAGGRRHSVHPCGHGGPEE